MRLWKRLLKGLKNNELESLSCMILDEQERRAQKRISESRFEILTAEEREMLKGDVDEAVSQYCERTGCPRVMAQMVMEQLEA